MLAGKALHIILVSLVSLPSLSIETAGQHRQPKEEEIHWFDQQEVVIDDFQAEGYVLAIGGGGEGIIGQLKGQQVIAIDISKRELVEAPPGPLKIVMDAKDLKFLDESFNTIAIFFTMMYIDGADHTKVLQEAHRVLASGGRILIWDAIFGPRPSPEKKMGIVPMIVKLPDRQVETGYGVRWPSEPHDLDYYKKTAQDAGFEIGESKIVGQWFFLELKKP